MGNASRVLGHDSCRNCIRSICGTVGLMKMLAFGIVVIGIAVLATCVWRTILWGRKCAGEGTVHMPHHKRMVNYTLCATVVLILFIEVFSKFADIHIKDTWLFVVHLSFAVPFLLLLIALRFWVTGERYRRLHRPLAYTLAGSFIGVLVTGVLILGIMMTA